MLLFACASIDVCEYQASNCELQFGVGVGNNEFILQYRARTSKLQYDSMQTDTARQVITTTIHIPGWSA